MCYCYIFLKLFKDTLNVKGINVAQGPITLASSFTRMNKNAKQYTIQTLVSGPPLNTVQQYTSLTFFHNLLC